MHLLDCFCMTFLSVTCCLTFSLLRILKTLQLFSVNDCFACLYVCAPDICLVPVEVKRRLKGAVSYHVAAASWTRVLCMSSKCWFTTKPILYPSPKSEGFKFVVFMLTCQEYFFLLISPPVFIPLYLFYFQQLVLLFLLCAFSPVSMGSLAYTLST